MGMTRLEFLRCLGAGCIFVAVGAVIGCAGIPVYRAQVRGGRATLSEAEFDLLLEDREDEAVLVRPAGDYEAVILVRTSARTYRAVSAVCTHQSCEVRFEHGGIRCPCHGSSFTLDGKVTRGPAKKPLPIYNVTVEEEMIHIDLTRNISGAASR